MTSAYETALVAHAAGLCVLPPKEDGTKAPDADTWTRYQTTCSTREEIDVWYADGRTGVGYVTGAVSGGLEAADFDDVAIYKAFREAARLAGLGSLLDAIRDGYLEQTPGGVHLLYRCSEISGNTKLARRPKRPEEMKDEHDKIAVLIETRGEGGYIVAAPSNGRVHPEGGVYRLVRGGLDTIATITPEERAELHTLAQTFDQMPKAEARTGRTLTTADDRRPGDAYNESNPDVRALLEQHNWTVVFERNGVHYLRRPGKDRGVSATLGFVGPNVFFPFTTSTAFEAERCYSPFGVCTILEHDGDYSAAARDLREQGYGAPQATVGQAASAASSKAPEPEWPTLDEAAFYGLAGDVVREIEPHTEGDPVAILLNFLAMFGSAVGPSPHARVGATRHRVNEFVVHVGETSRARKGTAHNEAERILTGADQHWKPRVMGGLSSGEGLIFAVRDPSYKLNKEGNQVLADAGAEDKRLLAVEPEFSSVLRVAGREGNTLSEQLRRAWDGNDLRTLTRNSPLCATAPHISWLGHITKPELLRELSEMYQANGFANRFLFVCVRRSKALPHGGMLPDFALLGLVGRVRKALDAARRRATVHRDAETNQMWEEVYSALTADRSGMFGAITARAEAHVLRLSLLYALLDGGEAIRRPHLEAALAVWHYAEDSAKFIFGDATGNPIADRVLSALRANGPMAQNEIGDLFGRNVSAARLAAALETLVQAGKIRSGREETGGRPRTTWEAVS